MFRRASRWLAPSAEDVHAAFKVLGLSSGASQEAVRSKYFELARRHHPDLSSGDDTTMKVINTAYELIQTHGKLAAPPAASSPTDPNVSSSGRFVRRVPRRSRVLADLADGESWATKSTVDWTVAMNDIEEKDLKNPANHPFSFSKHYSFEDDATIYRMIRTGAAVSQVARTLGKPATFVEKRLNNAQFKQRIQLLLKREKQASSERRRVDLREQTSVRQPRKHWDTMSYEERARYSGVYDDSVPLSESKVPEWSANQIASKIGRNYANFERFHKGKNQGR